MIPNHKKQRDIIIVLGKTGQGKSLWTSHYLLYKKRLLVFDPMRDLEVVYYDNTPELAAIIDYLHSMQAPDFNLGISNPDSLDLLGNAAFLMGDCILCIEEAAFVFPMHTRTPQWLRDIIFLGRHRGVSLIITAQRPVSIPIDLRSQASRVVSFAQHEGADVQWLRTYFGTQIYELPNLNPLECLDANNGLISRYKIALPTA